MNSIMITEDIKENENQSPIPNDVVDHTVTIETEIDRKLIVTQEDRSSPINQEGKKTYGRDFLIQLKDNPYSQIKPKNLPDMEVVLKDSKTQLACGMAGSSGNGGSIQPVRSRASYSCDTSKIKTKSPLMDDLQLENRNTYTMWNKNIPSVGSTKMQIKCSALENISSFDQEKRNPLQLSRPRLIRERNKPEKSLDELRSIVHMFVEEYITEGNGDYVVLEIKQHFPTSQLPAVIREIVNEIFGKSVNARESVSKLLSFLITKKLITLNDFRRGFGEVLESVDDLIIGIPKILFNFADLFVHLVIDETHPLAELPITLASLRSRGQSGKLVGELFSKMAIICGSEVLVEKWNSSKLLISDLINGERENIDEIIKNYKLQALVKEKVISFEQIHADLVKLIKAGSKTMDDDVVTWIKNNVPDKVLDPKFVRVLMAATFEASTGLLLKIFEKLSEDNGLDLVGNE
ncbi:uncharacterized protein LOC122508363 [Leptopilina heterotoma]|uniref:uncharacterized protein LOC122508363 n=1 Tax=Leptopilina heterotoma TaxID=63436 RepID=UPI001CA8747A|nr:uncharacterized protein LOC122508363 [Leptopilina heterotoma]